jgi:hypothetical protein
MIDRRIPIIYILSNGRSGSTLLDLLLGSHPEIWTLGEVQLLPREVHQGRLCGCGLPIRECEFWGSIVPSFSLFEGDYPIMHFRNDGGKAIRWTLLRDVLRRQLTTTERRRAAAEYGGRNAQFLNLVWQAAEMHSEARILWLVDASKDLYRLFWLQQSGLFDLRVIHLVKDPRAFVYSMVRTDLPVASTRAVRFASRWFVENALFAFFCRDSSMDGKTFQIRYEDLASDPKSVLGALGKWLDLEFLEYLSEGFRAAENHAVSGNAMRWQDTDICLDDSWRKLLPRRHARLVWMLTRTMARRLGYR